ncbi:MAG TPA: antibiotic biosynthesis monooxygenase [Bryobacteraceae bacterium]|jgi:quinol monooxygenase YgiN|nr:antibiotic biosynthesis monooxygenase [Bryobacteraceae bacterium]
MRFVVLTVSLLAAGLAGLPGTGVAQAQTPASQPVYVVTHIDLMPAGTATGVTLLKDFAAQTLKEKDCVRFEVLQQDGRPNHLTLVGIWKDKKAFDEHDSAGYTKKFREQMQPLIGSPWDERLHALIK